MTLSQWIALTLISTLFLTNCQKSDDGFKAREEPPTDQSGPCGNTQAQLGWDPPTTRVDSSPLPPEELYGHQVFWGFQPLADVGSYPFSMEIVGNSQERQEQVIDNLERGRTYYFAVKAIDTDRNYSTYSNEASLSIPERSCPISSKPEPPPFIPEGCKNSVTYTLNWEPLTYIQAYTLKLGFTPNKSVKDTDFSPSQNNYQLNHILRGQAYYVSLLGQKRQGLKKSSEEITIHFPTCIELGEILKEDPDYQENFESQINWK